MLLLGYALGTIYMLTVLQPPCPTTDPSTAAGLSLSSRLAPLAHAAF